MKTTKNALFSYSKEYIYLDLNMLLWQRHRMVNEVLQNELQNGVHALSIVVSVAYSTDTSVWFLAHL